MQPAASVWEYVTLPRGVYAGEEAGLKLVHDYGAFQLWKVDAAHRSELKSIVGPSYQLQGTSVDLPGGTFDPVKGSGPSDKRIPERAKSSSGPSVYLVQFVGPLTDAWLDAVRETGARTIQYINHNAYQVLVEPEAEQALRSLPVSKPMLRYVGEMTPAQKLSSSLNAMLDDTSDEAKSFHATVVIADHAAMGLTQNAIEALVSPRKDWYDLRGMHGLTFDASADAIRQIAAMGDVLVVEPAGERKRMDEVQAQIMAGHLNTGNTLPDAPGYLAWLTGLGFSTDPADYPIVSIVDDGIGDGTTAAGAGDFRLTENGDGSTSRLVFSTSCDGGAAGAAGTDGHGHLNATIAGGFDQSSGAPFQDPNGYLRGQGINPFTRLANVEIFGSGGPANCGSDDYGVAEAQGTQGIKISSNSWGYGSIFGPTTDYIAASRAYDIGVRDADSGTAGNQALTFIFAAGNDGPGANTVAAPGNAKNVITVGASENVRPSDEDGAWTDGCGIGGTGANSAMDVIDFSSRGPSVGGRTKPELIAPGTHVQGSASTAPGYTGDSVCDQYRPSGQTSLASSSGTSHSTPAVAGAASLVYRWLQTEYGLSDPSPALIKSYFVAHPTYMSGVGANDNLPSNSQGYGIPDLSAAFDDSTDRIIEDQTTTFTGPGQTHFVAASVADTAKPVRLVLSWTDAPGAASSTSPQVNNLDLSVTVDGTPYLGNVFTGAFSSTGGAADSANNYEAVFLPAGTNGVIEITVTATGINGDGVPGDADTTDQDFALVCSNCTASPVFTVSADPGTAMACAGASLPWNVEVDALNGYSGSVNLSLANVPAGASTGFSVNPLNVPPIGTSVLTVDTTGVGTGDYFMDIIGNDGVDSRNDTVSLQIDEVAPIATTLSMPADAATDVDTQPTFSWTAIADAREYTLDVDDDPAFGSIDYSATVSATSHTVPAALDPNTTYYWRVRAGNHCGSSADSAVFSFTTANLICLTFAGTGLPASIGPGSGVVTDSNATVSGLSGATITDVNVLGLRGTHSWMSDLDVDLIAPDTTTVRVFEDICGSNDNFHLNLDDSAATPVGAVCPPGDPGSAPIDAAPANALAGFNAVDPDGDWTLRITDDTGGDGGQFEAWTLEVCALVSTSAVLALDDTYAATEDTQLNVSAPGVLDNDTGTGLTASLTTPPASGTIVGGTIGTDGSFSYMPAPDVCGVAADSFTYTATDGVDSDTATVTIDITCTNDAPVADNDAYVGNINTTLNVAAPGVLDGDTDIDGDSLTATNLVQPTNGTVSLNADGSFSYVPNIATYCNDGSPTDDFTYTANDGTTDSAPATVAITVLCDELPVANDDSITVLEGGTATMLDGGNTSVKQNDSDAEDAGGVPGGDVTLVTDVTYGSLTLNVDGTFSYTHDDSENFTDSFTYTVADSIGGVSNEATVSIVITPVDDSAEIDIAPASLTFALASGDSDSQDVTITNVGSSTLDWELIASAGALTEELDIGTVTTPAVGSAVDFVIPGGVANSGTVVGFRFEGDLTFVGSDFNYGTDTCLQVTAPTGEQFLVGGFSGAVAPCNNIGGWGFDDEGALGSYSSDHDDAFAPGVTDAGNWTFSFSNGYSAASDPITWENVKITLVKLNEVPPGCDALDTVPWLSTASATSGSLAASAFDVLALDADATGMVGGTYNANLCVASNDPATPVASLPVELVVSAPQIAVDPVEINLTAMADGTDSEDLAIENEGDIDLHWSLATDEAPAPRASRTDVEIVRAPRASNGPMSSALHRMAGTSGVVVTQGTRRVVTQTHAVPYDVLLVTPDSELVPAGQGPSSSWMNSTTSRYQRTAQCRAG
ncbi:MAG: S8 family serine peptidase [Lysobacteraceae bacterium]